jgi:signal transduction histidine kinase
MRRDRPLAVFVLAVAGATLLFWLVVHQVAGLWLDVALRPEVHDALQRSLDDQKRLRGLDRARSDEYRRQFETTSRLLLRLDVLRMNRERMLQRFELALVMLFAASASIAAAFVWMRGRRARALERAQYLDRVSVLQETARRHAHELKGPLTAARLELERASDAAARDAGSDELALALGSVHDELDTLARLARQQASFAAIGAPVLRETTLGSVVAEFCATFADAWPNVTLRFAGGEATVCADPDQLRQVLVNLCTNAASAIEGSGTISFAIARRGGAVALDVSDSGGGIPESLRARVFDPYVTTRKAGEGLGLGLSISRKIMLDHGGDLQLAATSRAGTTFRLTFGELDECS